MHDCVILCEFNWLSRLCNTPRGCWTEDGIKPCHSYKAPLPLPMEICVYKNHCLGNVLPTVINSILPSIHLYFMQYSNYFGVELGTGFGSSPLLNSSLKGIPITGLHAKTSSMSKLSFRNKSFSKNTMNCGSEFTIYTVFT